MNDSEMTDELSEAVKTFALAPRLEEKWDAARRLMANRQRAKAADHPLLLDALFALEEWASTGQGIERLIAIDLLVRVPASIKRIKPKTRPLLAKALRSPIPPLSIVAEKRDLPNGAEPADVRENVALALSEATGDWVQSYVIKALAEEERSQNCRLVLAHEAAQRDVSVDRWLSQLVAELAILRVAQTSGPEAATNRLRDICLALSETVGNQRYRLVLSERAGRLLADLAQALVPLTSKQALPPRLDEAAAAMIRLLDELLAVRLTLMAEADLYEPLQLVQRWWSPLPYPKKLLESLAPITDKLIAGIVFRARSGQRSEALVSRLRQALNDEREARKRLASIANSELGLSGEIQDWLKGIERTPSHTALSNQGQLAAVGVEDFIRTFAPLLLVAMEIASTGPTSESITVDTMRLVALVRSIGDQYKLEVVGRAGDIVEYSPLAHETAQTTPPSEPSVRLVRPMVVRRRVDGSVDVIIKGLITAP